MNTKICEQCGNILTQEDLFCGDCGTKIKAASHSSNQFAEFSREMSNDSYNKRNKNAGYGIGIVVILMILAIIGYFVIKFIK